MNNKTDRALYGPSLFEVTLGALLSVVLGAVIAFLFLVFKPVVIAKELPKEEDRVEATVYYVAGKDDSAHDRQWIRKRQLLLDGKPGTMTLSEDEINACLQSGAPKKPKKVSPRPPPHKPGTPVTTIEAPPEDIPSDLLTYDVPNVRIRDGIFQAGVPASLNLITFSVPVVLQAQGGFEKRGDMWVFNPTAAYLGSMPLHRLPGLTRMMIHRIAQSDKISDDDIAAWKRVSNVFVSGHLMHLSISGAEVTEAAETAATPAVVQTSVAPVNTPVVEKSAPAAALAPTPANPTPTPSPSPTTLPTAVPTTTPLPTQPVSSPTSTLAPTAAPSSTPNSLSTPTAIPTAAPTTSPASSTPAPVAP